MSEIENLCEQCYYRERSRQACEDYLKRHPNGKGMVCDPTPKAECKDHELYGEKIGIKTACFDFRPLTDSEKLESVMKKGMPRFCKGIII